MTEPAPHDEEARRFHELWPLHALRYGVVLAGMLTWLFQSERNESLLVPALLLSLLLALELPLYSAGSSRVRPVWAAVQVSAGIAAFAAAPGLPAALVLSAVLSGVAATFPPLWAYGCLAAAGASAVAAMPDPFGDALGWIGAYALSVWVGRLFAVRIEESRAHRRAVAELEAAQARLAQYAETRRELAVAQERQRLAGEIHDALGHALVGVLMQVQVARRLAASQPRAAEERLLTVEQSVRETLGRVRRALQRGQRDHMDLALSVALENLVDDFAAAGGPEVALRFEPDAESVSDLAPNVAEVVYRTVQEALTNAVRHGRASRIQVELESVGPRLHLRIEDNGVGTGELVHGMGLTGMSGRVQSVGGTLRFHTAVGEGFRIEVGVRRR